MRYLLPAMAGRRRCSADRRRAGHRRTEPQHHRAPERVKAPRHPARLRPHRARRRRTSLVQRPGAARAARHRVKVVVRGPGGRVLGTTTEPQRHLRAALGADAIGNYAVRAYGVHDRRVRGSRERRPPGHRLPAGRRLLLRARPLRQRRRLRRHPDAGHARRRQQDAALRDQGEAALPRPLGHRAGGRPRPLRRRSRLRPDRGDQGAPRASPASATCSPAASQPRQPARAAEAQLPVCGSAIAPASAAPRPSLEAGDPDAEQAHRPRRVVGAQQVERHRRRPRPGRWSAPRRCASG